MINLEEYKAGKKMLIDIISRKVKAIRSQKKNR